MIKTFVAAFLGSLLGTGVTGYIVYRKIQSFNPMGGLLEGFAEPDSSQ